VRARRTRTTTRRAERGLTFPILALSLVGLFGFAGLVTDGAHAFAERRQVQNAADAAALAGANALNEHQVDGAPATSIHAAAVQAAGDNGVDAADVVCELVRSSGPTQVCPTASNHLGVPADAFTVRVTVDDRHPTTFMRVLGTDEFEVGALAAAAIRAATLENAPFMVCGVDRDLPQPLLVDNGGDPRTWPVNVAATGTVYEIWGNDVRATDCGNPSSAFRGVVNASDPPYGIPGWWENDPGNRAGGVDPQVPNQSMTVGNDACSTGFSGSSVGCLLVLPICAAGNDVPGRNFEMYCTRAGGFRVTSYSLEGNGGGQPRLTAEFVGPVTMAQGEGAGDPEPGEARVINLVE
jgi:hypothetical protein